MEFIASRRQISHRIAWGWPSPGRGPCTLRDDGSHRVPAEPQAQGQGAWEESTAHSPPLGGTDRAPTEGE